MYCIGSSKFQPHEMGLLGQKVPFDDYQGLCGICALEEQLINRKAISEFEGQHEIPGAGGCCEG